MKQSRIAVGCALLCIATALLNGCASSGTSASAQARCAAQPGDSTYAMFSAYRACAVTTQARLINSDLHPDFTPRQSCYSAEVEYVVLPNGSVASNSVHILKTNDNQFAEAVVTMANLRKYEPAVKDGAKVSQIVTDALKAQVVRVAVPAGQSRPSSPPKAPMSTC